MIAPYYHGLLVMILVQLRPSSIMGRPAELYLTIPLIDQVSFVLISSCRYISVIISQVSWKTECALNSHGWRKVCVYCLHVTYRFPWLHCPAQLVGRAWDYF